MELSQLVPLGEGFEWTHLERVDDSLRLHVTSTSRSCLCPLCGQPATRLHSRYRRVVKNLPCIGQPVQLILHVRKFFCDTPTCMRKVFAERLGPLVAPWAQMTTRLSQAIGALGLASCGRLGARLASRLFTDGEFVVGKEGLWSIGSSAGLSSRNNNLVDDGGSADHGATDTACRAG